MRKIYKNLLQKLLNIDIFNEESLLLLINNKFSTFKQINFIGLGCMDINLGNLMAKYDEKFRMNRCNMKFHKINNYNSFTIQKEYH